MTIFVKSKNMTQSTQQRLQALNTQLDVLLEDLARYSPEVLNQPPAPGSWSATQIFHHLMLSEKYSQQYCEKKLSHRPQLPRAGFLAWWRVQLVRGYLLSPIKFKAPAIIDTPALPATDTLANIATQYRAQRTALAAFLASVPAEYADKEVYKHPFGGRMSLAGMLAFFEAHFIAHRRQLYRGLKV